jgi:HTH DNA binding domain
MLSASLSFEGFKCRAIEMSGHSDYIEVANPTSHPHWITIHNKGHEILESMDWGKYCRSCPLRPLLAASNIHTTWFLASKNKVYVDVIAKERDYEQFLSKLNSTGVIYKVSRVHKMRRNNRPKGLTVNQLHVVQLAVEEGYFDTPKRIDTRGLSRKLECSPSTLCETLKHAEKRIMLDYLDTLGSAQVGREDGSRLENDSESDKSTYENNGSPKSKLAEDNLTK